MRFRRDQVRYHTRWVRLLCCFSWALAVINASQFDVLVTIDIFLLNVLVGGSRWVFPFVGRWIEVGVVLAVALAPAIPRFERPMAMVLYAGGMIFAVLFTTAIVFASTGVVLPLASPLLAGLGATAILETMAWGEERSRRTSLEVQDNARLQFTDMLVHDLRKHLSSVFASLSLLDKRLNRESDPRDLIGLLRAGADRVLLDINNLLDIRKIEEHCLVVRMEPMLLASALADAVREHAGVAEVADVRLVSRTDEGHPVQADKYLVARILANLLWNAIRHAPAGTMVDTTCEHNDGVAVLSVANRGAPIPPERRATLFRPFQSGTPAAGPDHEAGTGLGLAFCRLAVEAHKGTIGIESPRNDTHDGVCVTVRFPVANAMQ